MPITLAFPQNAHVPPRAASDAPPPLGVRERARSLLRRHGRKLWWLHSLYALALGAFVVAFAQRGFEHARWLAVTVGAAWLLLVAFFRVFDRGTQTYAAAAPPRMKIRFFVMTYALKNLYQGMLFFLLPFYWKSATVSAPNFWFVLVLGACALVSTLDLVFDHVLMRFRVVASIFHALTLFACLNLIVPAIFPNTRTLYALLAAAVLAVLAFWTLHVRVARLREVRIAILLGASVVAGGFAAYGLRVAIPPVPMHLSSAGVGPLLMADGRLSMEVSTLHADALSQLIAVTDVVVPGGKGDRLVHVWRKDGIEIHRAPEEMSRVAGPQGSVRLRSTLSGPALPDNAVGSWSVDVDTEDSQLVGRVTFRVVE